MSAMHIGAVCSSCGIRLSGRGSTVFKCPQCGRADIGRCARCRDQSVAFKCAECGFEGP
jgi:predicted RNA-binding Zn-ribbon protein involved in translation (DUF1610 family)